MPLSVTIETYGGAAPQGDSRFDISAVEIGGAAQTVAPVLDDFAPAQFFNLSDDDKLTSPSFEQLQAGFAISTTTASGASMARSVAYENWYIDSAGAAPREDTGVPVTLTTLTLNAFLLNSAAARSKFAQTGAQRFAGAQTPSVAPVELQYVVADSDTLKASSVGATGGQTFSQARSARDEAIVAAPGSAPSLVIAAAYEVAT